MLTSQEGLYSMELVISCNIPQDVGGIPYEMHKKIVFLHILCFLCAHIHLWYLRGRKWQEAEEDCIMRSFITYMFHQILLG
jgi:hypothetical protein